jgi:hypothetical protein
MRDYIIVVRIPNQLDPRSVVMIIKLMQVLEQKSSILDKKIQDTQTTFVFGLQIISHVARD